MEGELLARGVRRLQRHANLEAQVSRRLQTLFVNGIVLSLCEVEAYLELHARIVLFEANTSEVSAL